MWTETVSSRFGGLVSEFAEQVAGVSHAIVVSPDGALLAAAATLPRDHAEQLAAVASGLLSLTRGAAACLETGAVRQTVVDMQWATFLQMGIKDGYSLTVIVTSDCDIGLVAYEMVRLVERAGTSLAPQPHPHHSKRIDSPRADGRRTVRGE